MPHLTMRLALFLIATLLGVPVAAQWSYATLTAPRRGLAAVTVGELALFAGGAQSNGAMSAVVDIYDRATGTWTNATLSVARTGLAATVVGPYALFAGGANSPSTEVAVVDVFDTRTRTWSTTALSQARVQLAATTVGDKTFFAGGTFGGLGNPNRQASAVIDIYDASRGLPSDPNAWSTATLSAARSGLAAARAGTRALFAGGEASGSASAVVDVYDDATGSWSTATLSQARAIGTSSAASTGTRVFFAGGQNGATMSTAVDIYDAATDTWASTALSVARYGAAATVVGQTVLFVGGATTGYAPTILIDVFDLASGTWRAPTNLMAPRASVAVATVGGRALFAGGVIDVGGGSALTSRVDVFDTPNAETVRLGSPPNPNVLRPGTTNGPVLGAVWDPRIDHGSFMPAAVLDVLLVAVGPDNVPSPFGTLLCGSGAIALTGPAGTPITVPIPRDDGLVGATLTVQGASIDVATLALTNALDITIGTR